MIGLINANTLYEKTAELEAQALAYVEKLEPTEDHEEWVKWTAILNERTAFGHDIMDAPIIDAVPKNMVFHVDTYDDMTEEYAIEELTLEELLDKFTDEGYPNTLNALDALEEETCI